MKDWWEFIQKDLIALFAEFALKDMQYPFAMILWITLVSFSLQGIDRRDHIAGMTYTLYCTTTAIVFFLAMPYSYPSINDIGVHIAFVSLFVGITSYRWFHRNDTLIIVSTDNKEKNKKKQELDHEGHA
jgi:accessory gene regulator protein AgrB